MVAIFSTSFSVCRLYSIICAIVIIFNLCLPANFLRLCNLAIVPSSFIISQITPAGYNPDNLAISTLASVCPALTKTPPSLYFNGKICPGLIKSSGFDFGLIIFLIVKALSYAEMPVVIPFLASTDTVNAASLISSPFLIIGPIFKSFNRFPSTATQIRPLPYFAIKFIFDGVIFSAA